MGLGGRNAHPTPMGEVAFGKQSQKLSSRGSWIARLVAIVCQAETHVKSEHRKTGFDVWAAPQHPT